jgi:pyrroloquinoline quinone biosynthesis protein D
VTALVTEATLDEASVMVLPRWVRLRFDPVRDRHVLLAPERVLYPCATTVAILEALAEPRSLGALVDGLADGFEAPRAVIEADVRRLVADLVLQRLVVVG